MGYFILDVPTTDPQFGKVRRCTKCDSGLAARSGLNEQELALTATAIKGTSQTHAMLRYLVDAVIAQPTGWTVLWGDYGTAKTLAMQAIVAGCIRANISSRFYHARQLEQGWFDDINGDSNYGATYRNVPVLAIDEVDKINLKSDWVRAGFQSLMDSRYRAALAGQQLTLLICQADPAAVLPGDVVSRMNDGRFYRPWTGGANGHVAKRWDGRFLPGVLRIQGQDVRPMMQPQRITADASGQRNQEKSHAAA